MSNIITSSGAHLTVIETPDEIWQLLNDTYPQQFIELHQRKELPELPPESPVWVKNDDVSVVKP